MRPTDQRDAAVNLPVLLHQLLQPQLSLRHGLPVQTQRLVQLHRDRAPVQVVQEVLVHAHHIPGGVAIFGTAARRHRSGVQLEQIEGVGAEGGGICIVHYLQGRRSQCGAHDLELQEVFSNFQVKSFIRLALLDVTWEVRSEGVGLGAVSDVSELS